MPPHDQNEPGDELGLVYINYRWRVLIVELLERELNSVTRNMSDADRALIDNLIINLIEDFYTP